jgi:hypothetical protein
MTEGTTTSATSKLEITTFQTDFVFIKWYFKANLSDPDTIMVMLIPIDDVASGNLSSASFSYIDREFDAITNQTTFFIEGALPLGTVASDFPNDRYEATYLIGCNFLQQNDHVYIHGDIPGPSENYQASWSLTSDFDVASKLNEIPQFARNDVTGISCWMEMNLQIFHRSHSLNLYQS